MKVRDSGMPSEEQWAGYFDPVRTLVAFGLGTNIRDVVEFGSGYGTFTLPAAELVSGTVHALDIEPELIGIIEEKISLAGIGNVMAQGRDFVAEGTGLADQSCDVALQFNILHHAEPLALLREAHRVLVPGGCLAVMHWNYDPSTPRGPALDIRPRPEQCIQWGKTAGFHFDVCDRLDLPPYHYGLLFTRP